MILSNGVHRQYEFEFLNAYRIKNIFSIFLNFLPYNVSKIFCLSINNL